LFLLVQGLRIVATLNLRLQSVQSVTVVHCYCFLSLNSHCPSPCNSGVPSDNHADNDRTSGMFPSLTITPGPVCKRTRARVVLGDMTAIFCLVYLLFRAVFQGSQFMVSFLWQLRVMVSSKTLGNGFTKSVDCHWVPCASNVQDQVVCTKLE
jgi:hypothetical protein